VLRTHIPSLTLVALSALLLSASFPRLDQGYLAWICLVPLLLAVARAGTLGSAFAYGLLGGLLQWSLLLSWIPTVLIQYGGMPLPLAWLLLALLAALLAAYQAVACLVVRYLMKRSRTGALLSFPFVWVSLELFRTYLILGGFPWLLLGYSQTRWLSLIQVSDITGVFGVSFVIAWVNASLAWLLVQRRPWHAALWPAATGLVLVVGCATYGRAVLAEWSTVPALYRAALLQGNLDFDEPADTLAWKFDQGYRQLASKIADGPADLIVLPESPAPLSFQFDARYRDDVESLASRATLGLVFSNVHYLQAGGVTRYFNSAYFLEGDGNLAGRYDKIHLVPFGEYVPWRGLFFFAESITKDVGSFSPGSQYTVPRMGGRPLSALICFEAVFPQLARRFTQRDSQLIVNLTNDRWYGDSAAPYQHLEMARWRAVENRRYMLRAANSGISAIVEPTGRIQSSTALLRSAVCSGRFAFIRGETLYARYGDVFAALCAIISAVLIAVAAIGGRGRRA